MIPKHKPLTERAFKLRGVLGKVVAVILFFPLWVIDITYLFFFALEQILPLEDK